MGLFKKFRNKKSNARADTVKVELVSDAGNGFYMWDGKLYKSDIVRSCIRPKARAIGKLNARHVRNFNGKIDVNPDVYMRFLLEEPNPLMTGKVMQEKVATQLELNNNAFILIVRNTDMIPVALYPVPATGVESIYQNDLLYLRFYLMNGKSFIFPYSDIIHLRQDFNDNDIFGESPISAIKDLMEVSGTLDKGVIKAINNSGIVRWLLTFNGALRPEDLKRNVKEFVDNYLSVESETMGAAGVDAKATATQVEPTDIMPNAVQIDKTTKRIMQFFNTNEKIVQSSCNEDEWNSYYEAVVEPVAIQMSEEFTRKLFTRKERGYGNKIIFEAANLQCASVSTKLGLQAMVDRGALTPNEWRAVFNWAPVDGGDVPLRRKDTGTVGGGE